MRVNSIKAINTSIKDDEKSFVKYNILKQNHIFLIASLGLSIAAFVLFFVKGFNKSVDFAGGAQIEFVCKLHASGQDVPNADSGACLKLAKDILTEGGYKTFTAKIKNQSIVLQLNASEAKAQKDIDSINELLSLKMQQQGIDIIVEKSDFILQSFSSELVFKSILALVITFIAIAIYVAFRFTLAEGLSVMLTLIHDAVLTIGFVCIAGISLDISIIAAILTVIGYSVNDSVIIFDRIRSNKYLLARHSRFFVISKSINETFSRTIVTSLTTVFSVLAILLFAGHVIQGFAFTVLFGVVFGTYSSIFISSALLLYFED